MVRGRQPHEDSGKEYLKEKQHQKQIHGGGNELSMFMKEKEGEYEQWRMGGPET